MRFLLFLLLLAMLTYGAYAVYKSDQFYRRNKRIGEKVLFYQNNITSQDSAFMRRAVNLGNLALDSGYQYLSGCVVVQNNKIVGEGWHRVSKRNGPVAHATMEAILDACSKLNTLSLKNCSIYTSMLPCSMCRELLNQIGIKRIFYNDSSEKSGNSSRYLSPAVIYNSRDQHTICQPIPEIPLFVTTR